MAAPSGSSQVQSVPRWKMLVHAAVALLVLLSQQAFSLLMFPTHAQNDLSAVGEQFAAFHESPKLDVGAAVQMHQRSVYALAFYRHPCDHHLPALSWLEEIISTAFSWYALKYSSDNWSKCKLSLFAADYAHGLSGYLVQLQKCPANHLFAACNTVDALVQYDVHRMAQENRASQQVEIATVFQAFVDNPASLQMLGNYYLYRRMDGVTIDFERWHHDSDNPLISVLESVQPVKSSTPVD